MRRASSHSLAVVTTLALAGLLFALPAAGRSQRDLPWGMSQTWTSTIRLLRLDLGFEVTERDQEAGFILFQYVDGEHRHPGSIEIVERPMPDGRASVRVVVSVPALPSYVELHLIDRLERKLRDEVGSLPPPPPRPAATSRSGEPEDAEESPAPEPSGESED